MKIKVSEKALAYLQKKEITCLHLSIRVSGGG